MVFEENFSGDSPAPEPGPIWEGWASRDTFYRLLIYDITNLSISAMDIVFFKLQKATI